MFVEQSWNSEFKKVLIFVGFAVLILSPLILEGPTGPWQQTHSKHDDAFPVFLVNNCYHKDAA